MQAVAVNAAAGGILRYSRRDALLILLVVAHGAVLIGAPLAPIVALGLWWNSNTVSHNFIHKPFFRRRAWNRMFSCYLTLLLGVPQSFWQHRHLAHHAGRVWRWQLTPTILVESVLVLTLWSALLVWQPAFFATVYLPGYVGGLALCWLHGHYEHSRGTLSHYGRIYNRLFFNDGYHVEHHQNPQIHWSALPQAARTGTLASRWPAVLRWLELLSLENLERLVLRSKLLQWFVLKTHERAFRRLLPQLGVANRVAVVGGGLFPRTVLILRRLLPEAQLVVIDARAENIQTARSLIGEPIECICEWYDPSRHTGFDVVVIPLSFTGDREALYQQPSVPAIFLHDWIWRRRGTSAVVSLLLLKRLNLVRS
jgi:hypothetical protein